MRQPRIHSVLATVFINSGCWTDRPVRPTQFTGSASTDCGQGAGRQFDNMAPFCGQGYSTTPVACYSTVFHVFHDSDRVGTYCHAPARLTRPRSIAPSIRRQTMAARIFVRTRNLPFPIREPIERKKNIPAYHIRPMIIAVFRPYHGQLQTRFWRCDERRRNSSSKCPSRIYIRAVHQQRVLRAGSSAKGITPSFPS